MSGYDTDAQLDRINTAGDHSERKIGLSHRSMILRLLKVNCNPGLANPNLMLLTYAVVYSYQFSYLAVSCRVVSC